MRILVEPSDYVLRNAGDMAMLQASIRRLSSLWPDSKIQVLTRDPTGLRRLCPEAEPLDATGRASWLAIDEREQGSPQRRLRMWARTFLHPRQSLRIRQFKTSVKCADLLVVTGMGGITDAFPDYASDLLRTIGLAARHRKYIALFGQGIGPLSRPELVRLSRAVLPSVDLIALRENVLSEPLLLSLGVSSDRILTTGDDAIETAYNQRGRNGDCIGVNIRLADYSGLTHVFAQSLRRALDEIQHVLGAEMISIPISSVPGESDSESIETFFGLASPEPDRPVTPDEIIARVTCCRVVVTGSYHAGVFALACGIPVVGIAKTPYYVSKFEGLRQQFGSGCEVVYVNEIGDEPELKSKVLSLWSDADSLRPMLLTKAQDQITSGRAAYDRVKRELEKRRI